MKNIIEKFNDKQKEAITSPIGTSLVVAGAGSGKTSVLACRIAYLISECGLSQNRILAFTFTNKASNEMKSRVQDILGDITPYWINTFHGFCLRVLREDIIELGRDRNFTIIDEEDQIHLMRNIFTQHGIDKTLISHKLCLSHINGFKSKPFFDGESIEEYLSELDSFDMNARKQTIITKVFSEYKDMLDKQNLLDFNDLIRLTHKMFSECPEVLEKWQNRFDYLLVDEFQDTNFEQFEIIKMLCKDKTNIFVVGDPDQMIYSWRGAYSEIFSDFNKHFLNQQLYILDKNYRSTKKILNISNQLISNNNDRIKKDLYTDNNDGNNILYYHASHQDQESRWVIEKIKFLNHQKYNYSDIAILYRNNFLSRNIEQELIRNNIPYFIFGGFKFYQRKEIKDILAYLKLICNNDDISFSRIYNTPKRKISEKTISLIREYGYKKSISLYESLDFVDELDITSATKTACKEFKCIIAELKSKKFNSLLNLLEEALDKTGYLKWLESEEEVLRIENINELKNAIAQFEIQNPNCTLSEYLQEISLYTSFENDGIKDKNFVSLMTIHLAKGLEFKNVFIIEFNDGIFPSNRSIESNGIDEERRLAYVAMTRAKENLFIASSDGLMFQADSSAKKFPSRFLKEIKDFESFEVVNSTFKPLYELNNKKDWYNSNNLYKDMSNIYHDKNQDLSLGDAIVHEKFGDGIIIGVDKEIIEVAFKHPHGVKNLMKNHKSIIRKLS
ncbi:MAG: UvrD-helicase domain-containing protein [Malacoplasma sp.]